MRQRVGGVFHTLWQKNAFQPSMQQISQPWMPQLAGMESHLQEQDVVQQQHQQQPKEDQSWIWFAVPKRKHTRSRKRMKTTAHKRLKLKKNIVFDPRTGEVSLMHKMPFNWKDYLPPTPSKNGEE